MQNAITASVNFVHRHHILGIAVGNAFQSREFPLDSFPGGEKTADLDIKFFAITAGDEVHFLACGVSDDD